MGGTIRHLTVELSDEMTGELVSLRVEVHPHGLVRVWDEEAGYYSPKHGLRADVVEYVVAQALHARSV